MKESPTITTERRAPLSKPIGGVSGTGAPRATPDTQLVGKKHGKRYGTTRDKTYGMMPTTSSIAMNGTKVNGTADGRVRMDDADPLDAACARPSFLTGKKWSKERADWAAVWSRFPMYASKAKLKALLDSIADNQVTVIVSGTGSGKTVCCPPLVLKSRIIDRLGARSLLLHPSAPPSRSKDDKVTMYGSKVAVTTPKRVTTFNAANTAALTLDVPLGREVGYAFRNAPKDSMDRAATRLLFATDGFLLAESRSDPLLSDYAAIIIDEAHERPVPTDFLLSVVRKALRRRPDMRLVIMSATIDPHLFLSYFSEFRSGLVEVSGTPMFHVDMRFASKNSSPDSFLMDGIRAIDRLLASSTHPPAHHSPPPLRDLSGSGGNADRTERAAVQRGQTRAVPLRDVLMFVATSREALDGCRLFRRTCGGLDMSATATAACSDTECATLYSKMEDDARDRALAPPGIDDPWQRKVIFATNVAESSLTLKTLSHVVDGGFQLVSRWDATIHGTRVAKTYASQAQIRQRIGRVGRTSKGVAIMLYTRELFDLLDPYPTPSILTVDMSEYVLSAMQSGEDSLAHVVRDFGMLLTPPHPDQMRGAIRFLQFHCIVEVLGKTDEGGGRSAGGGRGLRGNRGRGIRWHGRGVGIGQGQGQGQQQGQGQGPGMNVDYADDDISVRRGDSYDDAVDDDDEWFERLSFRSSKTMKLSEIDGVLTSHGRWVHFVMMRLRLDVWNALLVCAGLMYGCREEACTLATILDACGGDTNALWWTPGIGDESQKKKQIDKKCVDAASDHLTLLNIYRLVYLKKRADKQALSNAGLSYGTWRSIHERLEEHNMSAVRDIKMPRRFVQQMADSFPYYALKSPSRNILRAVIASRMFHLAKTTADGRLTTVVPEVPVTVRSVQPMFASQPKETTPTSRPGLVYEHLSSVSGGPIELKIVTWLDELPPMEYLAGR